MWVLCSDIFILHKEPLKSFGFSNIWGVFEGQAHESQTNIISNTIDHHFEWDSLILEDHIVSLDLKVAEKVSVSTKRRVKNHTILLFKVCMMRDMVSIHL